MGPGRETGRRPRLQVGPKDSDETCMVRCLILTALLVFSSTGCFIIEELNASMQLMEDHSPLEPEKEESEDFEVVRPKLDEDFWENSRTITPGSGGGADIVTCNLRGKIQFMKRTECINGGGKPK